MDRLKAWFNKPFDSSMTATGWFAMVGLLIVSMMLWHMVLKRVEGQ